MVENREVGRQRIQAVITDLRPNVSEFDWIENVKNDIYLLRMGGLRLRIDQSAVDQAADEPEALRALQMEIERALLVSESGTGIGWVIEV